jgi:putative DNA primase/helicase
VAVLLDGNTEQDFRGHKTTKQRIAPVVLKASATGRDIAIEFCDRRAQPLIFYRGDLFEWRDTHYRLVSVDRLLTEIYTFLADALVKVPPKNSEGEWTTGPFRYDDRTTRQVLDALKHLEGKVFVSDNLDAPCWLRDRGNKPSPKNLIVVSNGILDLETEELLPHSPDFLTMTALPFAYDPEAKCERWEQFVAELYPSEETRREFQKAFGYTLSSDRSQQKMFLLIGPARAGKGVTIRVMVELLGRENTISPKLSELRQNFGMQQLIGKKAALFPDERLTQGTTPIVERLLSLSGEDDVSIPRKNKTNWAGRPTIRLWIATNTMPSFEDASGVIASRFILFKLTKSFAGNEDTTLTQTLKKELPGILNWSMEGLKMLQEDEAFIQPSEAAEQLAQMADIAAPIRPFVHDRMVLGDGRCVAVKRAYDVYKTWCQTSGHKPLSLTKFGSTIHDVFPEVNLRKRGARGSQVATLDGIGLRQAKAPANDDVEPEGGRARAVG